MSHPTPTAESTARRADRREQGRRNPTVVSLFELAQALDTEPASLLQPMGRDAPKS